MDGGVGTDWLDFSAYTSPVTLNLQAGSSTGLIGTFTHIEGMTGSTRSDTIFGTNSGATFNMTGMGAGNINGTFSFTSVENLVGGLGTDVLSYNTFTGPVIVTLQTGSASGLTSFSGFETVTGSISTGDAIIAHDAGSTLTVSGANSGVVDGLNFTSFENLMGGSGDDTFAFSGAGSLSGAIYGNAGTDLLTYSAYASAVTVNLQTQTATNLLGGFTSIEQLAGSGLTDTLIGKDNGLIFRINSANTGSISTYTFSSFENLTGGAGADTFIFAPGASISGNLNGGAGTDLLDFSTFGASVVVNLATGISTSIGGTESGIENLNGSALDDILTGNDNPNVINAIGGNDTITGNGGNDLFIFPLGAGFSGTLDGGLGNDTMDFSAHTTVFSTMLTGLGELDGFAGLLDGNPFINIDGMVASGVMGDGLTGMNAAATWNIGANNYGSGGRTFTFSNVEALTGGTQADMFTFANGAIFNGTIDGGSGSDALNYSVYTTARNLVLTGLGSADGFAGTEASITGGFTNINVYIGSAAATDSLTGRDVATTWMVDGTNQYINGANSINFSAVEILIGGNDVDTFNISGTRSFTLRGSGGADVFNFANAATLSGALDGGTGVDTLSFASYTTARNVLITAAGADGFAGKQAAIAGNFSNIDVLTGSAALTDTLTGLNADSTFTIAVASTYTTGGFILTFSAYENLVGGTAKDVFALIGTATLGGTIMGSGGLDTLDYSGYGSAVSVNLATWTASGTLGVSGIENITGSDFADILTGDANPNVIRGMGGNDTLAGGLGNDTYIFANVFGTDTVIEANGAGSDVLDFSAVSHGMTFSIGTAGLSGVYGGSNSVTASGLNIELVIGTSADDRFNFAAGGTFNGTLDGSLGTDRLDYSLFTTAVTVNLSTLTATGTLGVLNFENITGSPQADTLTGDIRNNVINGGAGNDILAGLDGNDTYVFANGFGTDTVVETALGGEDTLDFTALTSAITVTMVGNLLTVTTAPLSTNRVSHTGIYLEHVLGSSTHSTTLDLSTDTVIHNVVLTALGTLRGFQGAVDSSMTFDNIDTILASPLNGDTLTGMNADADWTITSSRTGIYQSTNNLAFDGFEKLNGGTKTDRFKVNEGIIFNGLIDGGAGIDTLTYSGYTYLVTIDLTGTGLVDGFSGMGTGLTGGFANINTLVGGSSALDTFNGTNENATFQFGATDTYSSSGHLITFLAFEMLYGGTGDDTFSFVSGHGFNGSIDGGAGDDTLTFASFGSSTQVNLTGRGSVDGMTGHSTALSETFSNFNIFVGASGSVAGSDTLVGRDLDAIFEINTINTYQIPADGRSVIFSGFNKLVGGSGKDIFKFVGLAIFNGDIDGALGTDKLDYSSYSSRVTSNLGGRSATGLNGIFTNLEGMIGSPFNDTLIGRPAGSIFHITAANTGTVDSNFTFTSVEMLQGGSAADILGYNLHAGPVAVTLTASDVNGFTGTATDLGVGFTNMDEVVGSASNADSLTGKNAASNWSLTGAVGGVYLSTQALTFSAFEKLIGGSDTDTFSITKGKIFSGSIDGGAGIDTLTYAGYITDVTVTLTHMGSTDGFNGTAPGLTSGFNNINILTGGNGADTLYGTNLDATFEIDGSDRYIYGTQDVSFTAFETLVGGTGHDRFAFADGATFNGTLNGGGNTDTLDDSAYMTGVNVNLLLGTATGVTGSVFSIENIIGGTNNDFLTGDDNSNIITGGPGNDTLSGLGGHDTYVFANGWGTDDVVDLSGQDVLDFSAVTDAINLTVNLLAQTVFGGGNTVTFAGIDVVIGGAGNDVFNIAGGALDYDLFGSAGSDTFNFLANGSISGALTGLIDGGAGLDVLNYQGDSISLLTSRYFTLTGIGASGFGGTEHSISAGFSNVDEIIGGLGPDTLVGLNLDGRFNIHTGSVDYTAGGTTLHTTFTENLVGGTGNDLFVFDNGAVLPGVANSIDGKTGTDTLDYSAYTTPVFVDLAGGVATGVTNGVASIEHIIGSFTSPTTLYGDDKNNTFNVTGSGGYNLYGRGGNDTYIFDADADLGTVNIYEDVANGGWGIDTLDFSPTTTLAVSVSLNTALTQTVNHNLTLTLFGTLENLIGGSLNDTLTGNSSANVITGGPGNDTISGLGGSDRYVFADGWGQDTITDSLGYDTFDFSGVTASLTADLAPDLAGGLVITSGTNRASSTLSEIENLIGGSGNDFFIFHNGVVMNGMLNGGSGTDRLDFAAYTTGRAIVLSAPGSVDGYAGMDSTIPAGFDNIEEISGSAGSDSLTGLSMNSHWTVATPVCTYSLDRSGRTLTFTNFETLAGSSANDVFTIATGSQAVVIYAGAGDDTLIMLNGASLTGLFDGQGGFDTLDYTAFTTSRNFYLNPVLGGTDDFNGTEISISGGMFNIQKILGGTATDSLHGRDTLAVYNIVNGEDTYTDVTNSRSLRFDAIEDLYGGALVDTFNLMGNHTGRLFGLGDNDLFNISGSAVLIGYADAGAGYDKLDYTSYSLASAFDLTGLGSDDGFDGTVASLTNGFRNFNWILGHVGSGLDSLQGLSSAGSWVLVNATGKSHYTTQSTTLDFSYIDSLIGEGGADAFVFGNGVTLTGSINGGLGSDTLDYSAYLTSRSIMLTDLSGTDGFAGTETSLANGFSGINQVIGSSTSRVDTLSTLNAVSTFTINAANGGTYASGGNTLNFSLMDKLIAGSGADLFNFAGSGMIATSIDAGGGKDEINYNSYGSPVTVNLFTGAATGVNGGAISSIRNYENVTGSAFNDSLTGDDGDNVITGLSGDDVLDGRAGNDTYKFGNGWGTDSVTDASGTDTFDFSTATTNLIFTQSGTLSVTDVANTVTHGSNAIENLLGGSGNDTFNLTGSGILTGTIDGNGGINTLSFVGHSSSRNISLTGIGTLDGFMGSEGSILGGFDNIRILVGSANNDTLTGLASGGTFAVTSSNGGAYSSAGRRITFTSVETLTGLAGYDTLDFSGYASPRNVTLTEANTNGFSGTEVSLSGFFNGMNQILGMAGVDSLKGMNSTATFELDGTNQYITGGFTLDISGIENIIGGSGTDTFRILISHTGQLDGGGGYDTLDYSSAPFAFNVILTSLGLLDGFNGAEANISGGFANMNSIIGGSLSGQLTGMNVAHVWNISPAITRYADGSNTIDLLHVDRIVGGTADDTFIISGHSHYSILGGDGNDTFTFQDGATLDGVLDGQAGNDFIDYHSYTTPVQVNLNSIAVRIGLVTYLQYTATGINDGAVNGISGIESVIGGSAGDMLIGSDGSNTFNGGPGNDTLVGGLGDDTYSFDNNWGIDVIYEAAGGGNDTITFTAATVQLTFTRGITLTCPSGTCVTDGINTLTHTGSQIENYTGGSAADTFIFAKGATLSGNLNGNGGADTLNFSAYTSALTVTLTALGSVDGYAGFASPLAGRFDNVDNLVGGSSSDTFTGLNSNSAFIINGTSNSFSQVASGRVLGLTSIEKLNGGSANDTFYFYNTAVLSGAIHGGLGSDTLDFSNYTRTINVNLSAGTVSSVSGGITSIENVIGSPFGNIITGDNHDNILIGTSGNDIIYGLGGNDILIGLGGDDILDGGTGFDTVDYSGNTTSGVIVNLALGTAISSESGNDTLISIENVIGTDFADTIIGDLNNNHIEGRGGNDVLDGSGGNDTYIFGDAWGVDTLTDSAGNDTVTFTAATTPLTFSVNLANLIVTSGVNSLITTGSIIENLVGGLGADNFTFADNAALAGTLDGKSGANTLDFSAYTTGRTVTLTNTGSLAGFKGIVSGVINGGCDNVTSVIGSGGVDTLVGLNVASTWNINNLGNTYVSSSRTLDFADVENLTGGTGSDSFDFIGSGALAGNINGGTGLNSLNYSGYLASGADVNLELATATGLGGTFSGIRTLVGSSVVDTLTGYIAGNTFHITGSNSGNVNGTFTFAAVENLAGAENNDTFVFSNGATLSGIIQALGGIDTLDYRAYITSLTVDLSTNNATSNGVTTTVFGIENIISGRGNDSITGDANDNIITDVGGTDTFNGGLGNDTYVFNSNWGSGDVVIDAGGIDTMTFAGIGTSLTFNLNTGILTVTDGVNNVGHSGYTIENLVGGSANDLFNINGAASTSLYGNGGNDRFAFNLTGSLTGNIDGGAGTNNTLDYGSFGSPVTFNLTTGTVTGMTGLLSNIQTFVGSGSSDTLVGYGAGSTFNVNGTNSGNVNGSLAFSSIENLTGSAGNDTFVFSDAGSISGRMDGVSGSDTLSFSGFGTPVVVTLTGADANGFSATSSGMAGFAHIDSLLGSTRTDTLIGANVPATFEVDGSNRYILGADSLLFSSFENLQGGSAADIFNISGTQTASLFGNAGADVFNFGNNAVLNGVIDAGADTDVINFSAYAAGIKLVLTMLGIDGFNGTTPVITGGFKNINSLIGSTGTDTLTGLNATAVFDLSAGTYTSGNLLTFTAIENLVGGSGADKFLINAMVSFNLKGGSGSDEFVFSNTNQLTGSIDGGSGTDTLNYSAYTDPVTANFGSHIATAVTGSISRVENFIGSSSYSNIVYGDDNDNVLVGGHSNDILIGGKGNDTYVFGDNWGVDKIIELPGEGNDTFDFTGETLSPLTFTFNGKEIAVVVGANSVITGTRMGNLDNYVENFLGSGQGNTFAFSNDAVVGGRVVGGSGTDVLDFSLYNSAQNFTLTGLGTVNGFRGILACIAGGFDNINEAIGSGYVDSLTGMNALSIWNITLAPQDTYVSAGHTFTYSAIETLKGGSADDAFVFANGASHAGTINGGAGTDVLDYSAYVSPVAVNLSAHVAEGVSGAVSGIENVFGGSGDDFLTGDNHSNVLSGLDGNDTIFGLGGNDTIIGGNGNDQLYGGSGNDQFLFSSGWGTDTLFENPTEGNDVMDFTAVAGNLTVTLGPIYVTDGINVAYYAGTNIEAIRTGSGNDSFNINSNYAVSLYGGAGNDQFVFANAAVLTGMIDGQGGNDTLDFSSYTTPRRVTLSGLGSLDGFSGSETAILGSFNNIDNVIGSSGVGDVLTGRNANAIFELDGTDRYISGNTLVFSGFESLQGGSKNDLFQISGLRTYNLLGGAGNDTFAFENDAYLTGIVDGSSGLNTIDFSAYISGRSIYLTGYGSITGFTGSEFSFIGSFTNINGLIGSNASDSISGTNDPGVWTLKPSSSTYLANNRLLTFDGIESINGSGYDDRYVFVDGAFLTGSIDARGGNDTVDLSRYTTSVFANLLTGFLSTVGAGITSIENVIGGQADDILIGDDYGNILDGGPGNDLLDGRGGNDTLYTGSGSHNILYGGLGNDTAYIAYGAGYEIPNQDIETIIFLQLMVPPVIPTAALGNPIAIQISRLGGILIIPVVSDQRVRIDYQGYAAIALRLPDGNQVIFSGEVVTESSLTELFASKLPGALPEIYSLVYGMTIRLFNHTQPFMTTVNPYLVSFVVPNWLQKYALTILFWNETAGAWVEVPSIRTLDPYGQGSSRHVATVTRLGTYVLVVKNTRQALVCLGEKGLSLPGGENLTLQCNTVGQVLIKPEVIWNLPALPAGLTFFSSLTVNLTDKDEKSSTLPLGQTMEVSFPLQPELLDQEWLILRRSNTSWTELPGVVVKNGQASVKLDAAGTFVLVLRPRQELVACANGEGKVEIDGTSLTIACTTPTNLAFVHLTERSLPAPLLMLGPSLGSLSSGLIQGGMLTALFPSESKLTWHISNVENANIYLLMAYDPALYAGQGGWVLQKKLSPEKNTLTIPLLISNTYLLMLEH